MMNSIFNEPLLWMLFYCIRNKRDGLATNLIRTSGASKIKIAKEKYKN